ncbi:BQ5605_C005g03363 [Microbotryum silenes-dioicae]|uniref:BQ5605_C005g03363 protein n=1 Tax=Microbotryum silenes-dioicae TaxID=796604 RepID=A0A2X0P5V1_9BASI|nr:BQ5605_C005g03363 [Microbotryum silenes-dioicae]
MFEMLREQFFGKVVAPTQRLDGRTVIITGSNVGLGLHAAIHLARLNPARLILAVRTPSKGETARAQIAEQASFDLNHIHVWQLDLASFDSVKAFAKRCEDELDRLDVMVENAAIATFGFKKTEDGWEESLQTNVLSTGLLGLLLIPLLRKTAKLPSPCPESSGLKTHLTIVGSEVHGWARFEEAKVPGSTLDALNSPEHFYKTDRYNITKLLNMYLAHNLARILEKDSVIVNVVNPGLCVSELRKEMSWVFGKMLDMAARTTEDGSKNIAWAAVEDTSSTAGAYISVCEIKSPAASLATQKNQALQQKVWDEMCEVWKKVAPQVAKDLA